MPSLTTITHLRESETHPVCTMRIADNGMAFAQHGSITDVDLTSLKEHVLQAAGDLQHPDGRLNTEAIRKAHRYLQIYCQMEADNRTLGREPAQSIKRAEYAFALAMTTNPTEESAKRTIRAVQRSLNEALEMATEEEAAFIRTKAKILLLEHLIPE